MQNPNLKQAAKLAIDSRALTGSLSDIELVTRISRCLDSGVAQSALYELLRDGDDLTDLVRLTTH